MIDLLKSAPQPLREFYRDPNEKNKARFERVIGRDYPLTERIFSSNFKKFYIKDHKEAF